MAKINNGPSDREMSLARFEALKKNGEEIREKIRGLYERPAILRKAIDAWEANLFSLISELNKLEGAVKNSPGYAKTQLDDISDKMHKVRIFCDWGYLEYI